MENISSIKKVRTYKNVITATKSDMSGKSDKREPGKKNKRITRTKITRRNAMIEK